MYCTQCGFKLDEGDVFCAKCGRGIRDDAPPRAQSSRRRLVRPMGGKKVGGVCAGFADYLDIDVTLVRILTLVLAIFTGVGFIAYVVAWIAMPPVYGPVGAPATQHA
jgi:phage shock protein PspC (stress-responsive transcriptional regulator)